MQADLEYIAPYLAFRPFGSSDWVAIDPGTSRGRRLAASFGFTIPKEFVMSAQPTLDQIERDLDATERHLRVVENNVEKMGLLVQARAKGHQAYGYIRKSAGVAWDWIRETFHLDPAMEFIGSVLTWLRNQISILTAHFGATGGAGLGLLAVSTTAGRRMLGFALKPVLWVLEKAVTIWTKVENVLYVEPEQGQTLGVIGRVRNWLARGMASIREFFTGSDGIDASPGFIERSFTWYVKHVAPHMALGSTTMVAARTAGFGLAGSKLVSMLALAPITTTALAISQWVLGGLVVSAMAANVIELGKRAWGWLTGTKPAVVLHSVPEPKAAPASAGAPAAQAAKVAEKVTTVPTPAAVAKAANGNRATRRAAEKAAAAAPAKA